MHASETKPVTTRTHTHSKQICTRKCRKDSFENGWNSITLEGRDKTMVGLMVLDDDIDDVLVEFKTFVQLSFFVDSSTSLPQLSVR